MGTSPTQMQGQMMQQGRRRRFPGFGRGGQFGQGDEGFDFDQLMGNFKGFQGFDQSQGQMPNFQRFDQGGNFAQQPMQRTQQAPRNPAGFAFRPGAQPHFNGGVPSFGPQGQAQQGQGMQTLASGTALTRGNLDPFLGGAGNVKYDPFTGQEIPYEDRVKPGQYMNRQLNDQSRGLLTGPAIQEAMGFEFQDLPTSISAQGGTLDQLGGAARGLLSQSGQQLAQGGQTLGTGISDLLGTRSDVSGQAGQEAQIREQALNELQQLQRQALSPTLDREQRALFQQRADERRAEIQGMEGNLVDAFQRGRASDSAQLAAQGVLDSTSGENVAAERERRLGQDIYGLTQQANELSRQEQLAERSRIGQTAGQFGQLQGLQAAQTGDILSNLLGTQASIGANVGQLGLGQQGIGAELGKLGISGLGTAGELGLQSRGQEADLQQSELSTRLLGNQLGLQNIQSFLNQQLGRKATKQEMDYFNQLMGQMGQGGGNSPLQNIFDPFSIFS